MFTEYITMTNLASVLKEEVARLARKEIRKETEALKSASARYRTEIAALKRRLDSLERALAKSSRDSGAVDSSAVKNPAEPKALRFSAAGLKKLRTRLDLSASLFGQLIGVSGQTIYNWESGSTRPQPDQIASIAVLRTIGRRQLAEKLAAIEQG